MGFFRKGYNKQFKTNQFKQNKPNTDKKSWDLSPIVNHRLLLWKDKVTDKFTTHLREQPKNAQIGHRLITAYKRVWRRKFKISVKQGKKFLTANRNRRKLTVRASLKPRKVVYFFSRTPLKKRGTKYQQAKKIRQVKGTANALKKQGPKSRHVKQIPKVKGTSNALKKRSLKSRHVKQVLTVKGASNALNRRGPKSRRARKSLMVKDASSALYQYRLSNLYINKLVKRGLGQATIARWPGGFLLAALKAARLENKFWKRYTFKHPKWSKIKKQKAYEDRNFGGRSVFRYVLEKTRRAVLLKKAVVTGGFRSRLKPRQLLWTAGNSRRKALLWRHTIISRTWGERYFGLQFKFDEHSAQETRLGFDRKFRRTWHKRSWLNYKLNQFGYKTDFFTKLNIKQLEELKKKWGAAIAQSRLRKFPVKNKRLIRDLVWLNEHLVERKAPVPWWNKKKEEHRKRMEQKEKMEQKRRNLFNNLPADAILPSRRLMRLRWFKVVSRRFAAFNNNSVAWGGAAKGVLAQHYSFLVFRNKKKNKKTKKVGVHYVSYTGKCELKRLYAANKVALLKAHLMDKNVGRSDLIKGVRLQTRKPVFFSVRQATSTLDFNKFFKVNRVVARNMNAISVDLYSQYITNLQASCSASSTIMSQNVDKTALGKRALRKYVLLLQHYFNEVYDRKMAKNIPASSAMHWIRQYLRLTGDTWRRNSLWNRFNRVAFNFRPKAKEDEKRGRKKKILFRAKILFDRLFDWLYAQPNARYALATPIQKGVVRDYIVRNQFIFKKKFKMKVHSK